MNMDAMMLQMIAQLSTQTYESGKTAPKKDVQDSFQDLMAQKNQNKATQGGGQKADVQDKQAETPKEEPAGEANEVTDEQRILAAALAAQATVVIPVEDMAAPASVEAVVVAAVPAVQAVAAEQPVAAVSDGEGQTALPHQETKTDAQNVEQSIVDTSEEMVVPLEKPVAEVAASKAADNQPVAETKESFQIADKLAHTPADVQDAGSEATGAEVTDLQGAAAEAKPLFQKVVATPVKVGEPEVVDTTAGDMDNKLVQQVEKALSQGAERIELKLTPENLGTITVEMTRNPEGVLHVALHTSSEKTWNLLSEHAEHLGVLLQTNNQAPVSVEVPRGQENQQAQYQQQQQQGGNSQSQQQQQQGQGQQRDIQDFLQQLRLGLAPLESEVS